MKIKLCDILTIIDNNDYIDLRIYNVCKSGHTHCGYSYDDLHKEDIINDFKIYFNYYVKFMFWYDNHLVLEVYR